MSSVILKISPQFLISSCFFSKNFLVQLHRQLKQTHNLCNVSTLNLVDSTKTVVHNKRDEKNKRKRANSKCKVKQTQLVISG